MFVESRSPERDNEGNNFDLINMLHLRKKLF